MSLMSPLQVITAALEVIGIKPKVEAPAPKPIKNTPSEIAEVRALVENSSAAHLLRPLNEKKEL